MDLKFITKQLVFILLIMFFGQNCASNTGPIKQKKCQQACKTEECNTKKCKKKCKKSCKKKACKKEKNNTQKIDVSSINSQSNFPAENINPDLSVLAAHSLEIADLRSKVAYLEDKLNAYENEAFSSDSQLRYSKKIVLDNGTTLLGNIVTKDEYWAQVETKIGILSIASNSIVRIVDAVPATPAIELNDTFLEIPVDNSMNQKKRSQDDAEVVLSSELFETRDSAYNTMISGEVQNKGTKRADFVKITFTVYKNQNYNTTTKDYTVFVDGSTVAFEHGSVSSSSLYPNETADFSVMIPSDFGPFISYSYRIDWELYE